MEEPAYLLIWFLDGQPHTCTLTSIPDALLYAGKTFERQPGYFGDVDYLRDQKGRLIGFSYVSGSELESRFRERLVAQSKSVQLDGILLLILLAPSPYETECVQAMGTEIYRSSTDEIMLAIPNWGFGEMAFKLAVIENVPWPEHFEGRE